MSTSVHALAIEVERMRARASCSHRGLATPAWKLEKETLRVRTARVQAGKGGPNVNTFVVLGRQENIGRRLQANRCVVIEMTCCLCWLLGHCLQSASSIWDARIVNNNLEVAYAQLKCILKANCMP